MVVTVVIIVVALLIAAVVTFATIARRRSREPVAVVPAARVVGPARPYVEPLPTVDIADAIVEPSASAPALFDRDTEPEISTHGEPDIRWYTQFDKRSGALDDTARLRLIGDLGVVAKDWCIPLLSAAYAQERRPGLRQAALTALAACRSSNAVETFRIALASSDAAERAIATDALTDLEPPVQTKARTVVERR